jgi:hypothetical protein
LREESLQNEGKSQSERAECGRAEPILTTGGKAVVQESLDVERRAQPQTPKLLAPESFHEIHEIGEIGEVNARPLHPCSLASPREDINLDLRFSATR